MAKLQETKKPEMTDDLLQLVGFNLGEEEFGVDILKIQEINRIVEITQVPQSPSFVEGVINLRGVVIPIIDLRSKFGLKTREKDKQTRIIVAEVHEKTLGFTVDSVSEVIRIPRSTVEPPPPIVTGGHADFIEGVGKIKERLLILLDLDKLFTEGEIADLRGVAEA